jgi:hypothetical protein
MPMCTQLALHTLITNGMEAFQQCSSWSGHKPFMEWTQQQVTLVWN